MANTPIKRIKVGNGISVSIWKNRSDSGGAWYTSKISRFYKDGEEMKDTASFRRGDLLFVAKAAEMAFAWIYQQQAKAKAAQAED